MRNPFNISRFDYWIYGLSLGLCFLLFKQSDLTHTNSSSFAYLYGHFWDFYDYNSFRMGDNNYLPIFYWIFALWNLPLKLLGLIPEVTNQTWMLSTPIQTLWSKTLLAIFFLGSVVLIRKISDLICPLDQSNLGHGQKLVPMLLFSTSPIAIFSIFIFSGYDIFGVFFTLLGLLAYFQKKWKWFVIWFSVAISFKYFAAFIYLPLVLIIERRFLYVLIYGALGLLFTALQFAMYWHSEVFIGQIFHLVSVKTNDGSAGFRPFIINLAYCLMCGYLYFFPVNFDIDMDKWYRRAIFACLLSYAFLFSWVKWHPQWVLLITPFICLSFLFIQSQRLLLTLETLGYLGFAIYTMNNWAGNVDNTMVYGGIFGEFIPQTTTLATDVIGRKWMGLSRVLFYLSLYAPLLIVFFESYFPKKDRGMTFRGLKSDNFLFGMRFLFGSYLVMIVTVACLVRG
jgi:hypothetical protein